ncbi:YbdD/YjiX family protein [Paludibacterium paludis]|uniref:YbdD/YjiX family protein n=1 Tax=Paludibacterium paludis TaxID=1225769 RepID=A0A918UAH8_9NEIS|nr:CstA-like transporter-associated (seleno)protein [Paludibacterium paludis]GGY16853.1 hypothetical protein GCM10011289_20370 [Paludibacterium paludis]
MRDTVTKLFGRLAQTARLMVGVKDYETYVARRRELGPDAPVMSREDFLRYCQEARHGGKHAGKCPC